MPSFLQFDHNADQSYDDGCSEEPAGKELDPLVAVLTV